MVAPCCVHLLCALNIQYQVLSCSKDSHLEPSVRGGPEVTLFRRDLGVLACSLLHSLMRTNWRAALSSPIAWLFPENTWLCCSSLYCHGHHTLCAVTNLLPLSQAKPPGNASAATWCAVGNGTAKEFGGGGIVRQQLQRRPGAGTLIVIQI